MGAFVLFPVLLFSIFTTAVLGIFDYVHVETEVHAAAQTAVTAAAQELNPLSANGSFNGLGSGEVGVDQPNASAVMSQMLTNKPYITGWACSTSGTTYNCDVNFKVSLPILGDVKTSTTVQGTYTINAPS
jgi:Flp pilus assembly protein TadG